MAELDERIRELSADPEASEVPWLDRRPLDEPPRPWSEEDWQRDQRRTGRPGVSLDRSTWTAYAEGGQDAVWQLADAERQERLTIARADRERLLAAARESERRKRQVAHDLFDEINAAKREQERIKRLNPTNGAWRSARRVRGPGSCSKDRQRAEALRAGVDDRVETGGRAETGTGNRARGETVDRGAGGALLLGVRSR